MCLFASMLDLGVLYNFTYLYLCVEVYVKTGHVCSTREGNVFSRGCLSVHSYSIVHWESIS